MQTKDEKMQKIHCPISSSIQPKLIMYEDFGKEMIRNIYEWSAVAFGEFLVKKKVSKNHKVSFTSSGRTSLVEGVQTFTPFNSASFSNCEISPLFVSIYALYKKSPDYDAIGLEILTTLLEHGFPTDVVQNMTVCNIPQLKDFTKLEVDPYSFTKWLKSQEKASPSQQAMMTKVLELLKNKNPKVGELLRPMTEIPTTTYTHWKAMLFNASCSDIVFDCGKGDEGMIPANSGILKASSEYFAAFLSDRWRDASRGTIQTDLSPDIIKAMLGFLYVGELDTGLLQGRAVDLLDAASQFMLEDLKELCENQMSRSLTIDLVYGSLITSHLHQCPALQEACYDFIKEHPAVLTKPSFFALATKYPSLWRDLTVAMGGEPESDSSGGEGGDGEGVQERGVAVGGKRKR